MPKLKLTFVEGAGSVTGANILLADENSKLKILFDCGLVQGHSIAEDRNWHDFPYNPSEIDYLIVSHAHIDHIGKIPKLIHDGFAGKIISTDATRDLALPMLEDTAHLLSKIQGHNIGQIYNSETIKKALDLWEGKKYYEEFVIGNGIHVKFLDSGHILGSAITRIFYGNSTFYYTGDLGNSPSPLLRDTDKITDANYMVMESVYGDRNHETHQDRRQIFIDVIKETEKRSSTLIVPLFSLERTQEILFEMNNFALEGLIPKIPVYLDSPLAIRLTDIYKKYKDYFNEKVRQELQTDDDIFSFPGLKITRETDESKSILHASDPKIILAGSGMSNGGRIIHHEKNYLPYKKNILLLTGYQTMGTLGRHIEDGDKTVRIFGEQIPVLAEVRKIDGYSGHKDMDNLVSFVSDTKTSLKKLFIALGENKSAMFLAQKIKNNLDINAVVPENGQSFDLEF